MPSPAHPFPRGSGHDTVPYHRRYLDSLGQPLEGTVTIARKSAASTGQTVLTGAPARAELVGGHLSVRLAPGEYELVAQLRTRDGVGQVHKDSVTVTAA